MDYGLGDVDYGLGDVDYGLGHVDLLYGIHTYATAMLTKSDSLQLCNISADLGEGRIPIRLQ